MIELYLIRHGECFGSGTYIGRGSNVDLTADGIKQIHSLGNKLNTEYNLKELDFIYSSPLKRCLQTTEILKDYYSVDVEYSKDLEETDFGDWESLGFSQLKLEYKDIYSNWINNPTELSPPNGESLLDLKNRVEAFLTKLDKYIIDDKVWRIGIVTHKGPTSLIILHFLKLELDKFWSFKADRGSVSKINIYKNFSEVDFLNLR